MIPKYLSDIDVIDVLVLSYLKAAGSGMIKIAMARSIPIITSGL